MTPFVSPGATANAILFAPVAPSVAPWKSMDASPPMLLPAPIAVVEARPPKLIVTVPAPVWVVEMTFVAPRNAVSHPRFCTDPAELPV